MRQREYFVATEASEKNSIIQERQTLLSLELPLFTSVSFFIIGVFFVCGAINDDDDDDDDDKKPSHP